MFFDVPLAPVVTALVLYGLALRALWRFTFARDFRVACLSFAVVGLAGAVIHPSYAWLCCGIRRCRS